MLEHWHDECMIVRGEACYPHLLPGFIAEREGQWLGVITYRMTVSECEVISLDSLEEGHGIGTSLIDAVTVVARQTGCTRIWLITTNDNLPALRFYQKRGFHLVAIHRNVIQHAR